MRCTRGSREVLYASKGSDHDPNQPLPKAESIDALEFIARVIDQIPDPRKHSVFYYGFYSNVARGLRMKNQLPDSREQTSPRPTPHQDSAFSPAQKAALRRRWADLIRRVYEVDPLICTRCGGQLHIISFITQTTVIRKIGDHLNRKPNDRAPPRKPVPKNFTLSLPF